MTTATLTDQTDAAMGAIRRAEAATGTRKPTTRRTATKTAATRLTATAKKPPQKPAQAQPKRTSKAVVKKAEPKATTEVDPKAYAPQDVTLALAERINAIRNLGWTRPMLQDLMGMTGSAVWRVEHQKVHAGEVATVTAALDRIDTGEVTLPEKPATAGGGRPKGPSNADLLAKIVELEAKIDALTKLVKTTK